MGDIMQTIKKRVSVRTYDQRELRGKDREKVMEILQDQRGPFGHRVRLQVLELSTLDKKQIKQLGTYGIFKGVQTYLIGAVLLEEKALEDFGYVFEKIILELTKMGLATCWIAGSFNRVSFAQRIELQEGEILPAVSPLGYPAEKPSLVEKIMHRVVKSRHRKPWSELFFDIETGAPLNEKKLGAYAQPLEAVRLAPSAVNRQPWRVAKEKGVDIYHFYYEGEKGYTGEKQFQPWFLHNINMGIALAHFELTARELGLEGTWQETSQLKTNNCHYVISWMGENALT